MGIIRLAPVVTCLVGLAATTACGFGQSSPSSGASPSPRARAATPSPSPSSGTGDTSQLPAAPLRQGQKLGDDSVQVGNPSYVLHSYKLDAGGFESFVSFKQGNTAYLFDFKQSTGSQPDTALFETILGTVIVS